MKKNQKKTIDLTYGAVIMGGNESSAQKMIAALVAALPLAKNELSAAFTTKNLTKLSQFMHKFCGGIAYCGVPELQKIAEELKLKLSENLAFKQLLPWHKKLVGEIDSITAEYEEEC